MPFSAHFYENVVLFLLSILVICSVSVADSAVNVAFDVDSRRSAGFEGRAQSHLPVIGGTEKTLVQTVSGCLQDPVEQANVQARYTRIVSELDKSLRQTQILVKGCPTTTQLQTETRTLKRIGAQLKGLTRSFKRIFPKVQGIYCPALPPMEGACNRTWINSYVQTIKKAESQAQVAWKCLTIPAQDACNEIANQYIVQLDIIQCQITRITTCFANYDNGPSCRKPPTKKPTQISKKTTNDSSPRKTAAKRAKSKNIETTARKVPKQTITDLVADVGSSLEMLGYSNRTETSEDWLKTRLRNAASVEKRARKILRALVKNLNGVIPACFIRRLQAIDENLEKILSEIPEPVIKCQLKRVLDIFERRLRLSRGLGRCFTKTLPLVPSQYQTKMGNAILGYAKAEEENMAIVDGVQSRSRNRTNTRTSAPRGTSVVETAKTPSNSTGFVPDNNADISRMNILFTDVRDLIKGDLTALSELEAVAKQAASKSKKKPSKAVTARLEAALRAQKTAAQNLLDLFSLKMIPTAEQATKIVAAILKYSDARLALLPAVSDYVDGLDSSQQVLLNNARVNWYYHANLVLEAVTLLEPYIGPIDIYQFYN